MENAIERGKTAIQQALQQISWQEPFAVTLLRAHEQFVGEVDYRSLFAFWKTRSVGPPIGDMRYRWELNHRCIPAPVYAGEQDTWEPWREVEQQVFSRDPNKFEDTLSVPILTAETCDLLSQLSQKEGPHQEFALQVLDEAASVYRQDMAFHVQGKKAWSDTFALYCLTRYGKTLALLHPFAIAIAAVYASNAKKTEGVVKGMRFPFHNVPLVSASAFLASGLLVLGQELPLISSLLTFVKGQQKESGGWADGEHPEDIFTTFAAADLLAHVDPSFETESACAFLVSRQMEAGWWRALGPEQPWLTGQVMQWLTSIQRPFPFRYRWPHCAEGQLDRKTHLPFYAYFDDLCRIFSSLPGLAEAQNEVAFIDLAGFRKFNNTYGQEFGDKVLEVFADELKKLPATSAIRDGGDEFLLIGAPTGMQLTTQVQQLRHEWPKRFRQEFGSEAPPVIARILLKRCKGAELLACREALGRAIGAHKHLTAQDELGIFVDLGVL
ncbi:MAG: hypothetical protein CL920_21460 [Deltaproteobacteria bacterium]|nr:hypothetical protein [Deltaproteobacteria bacterium]MBU51265.1 hypothetical protein [Deltaproteobacteria bacterium]|tara:strand:- start:1807 stop:3294 length:1488 start_codon:yes stop_codon:yes gene_type:complete